MVSYPDEYEKLCFPNSVLSISDPQHGELCWTGTAIQQLSHLKEHCTAISIRRVDVTCKKINLT